MLKYKHIDFETNYIDIEILCSAVLHGTRQKGRGNTFTILRVA